MNLKKKKDKIKMTSGKISPHFVSCIRMYHLQTKTNIVTTMCLPTSGRDEHFFPNHTCLCQIKENYLEQRWLFYVNPDNKVGAVGFTTMIAPFLYPITLIRVDEQGEHMRDRNGVCIKAKPGERGELVGKIVKGDALREFDGYVNKSATSKKICANVFKKGDLAFLTGDVLIMDQFGYFYFQDRTGDTFRWRGENVSTMEVEAVISNIVKLCDSVVYGVEVQGVEGRAGMVAIEDQNDNLDLHYLHTELQKALASYARPVFVRLLKNVATTGTFKLKKVELRQEGFDPSKVKDRLFYMNSKSGSYEPITPQVYRDICNGKIRL